VHVPFIIALGIAHVVAHLPRAPITVSNVLGSNQDTGMDIGPARRDLQFQPMDLDAGLKLVIDVSAGERRPIDDRQVVVEDDRQLERDCRMIFSALIDGEPTPDLIARYRTAVRLKIPAHDRDDAEWRWVRRHPRALPLLDAAAALVRPRSPLRQRMYLMTAILETAPAHAGQFLPRTQSISSLITVLAWNAVRALGNAAVGLPLLAWARHFG